MSRHETISYVTIKYYIITKRHNKTPNNSVTYKITFKHYKTISLNAKHKTTFKHYKTT